MDSLELADNAHVQALASALNRMQLIIAECIPE